MPRTVSNYVLRADRRGHFSAGPRSRTTVRLPLDLFAALVQEAERRGLSLNDAFEAAVRTYLAPRADMTTRTHHPVA